GLLGALYVPSDGVADPSMITQSLAAGARKHGVIFKQGENVTGFDRRDSRIHAVRTDQGEIECRIVVSAAGVWARQLGMKMGVSLACCGVEHQYLITEAVAGLTSDMPSLRDPDLSLYYKPESNGLLVGCWEPDTIAFDNDPIPGSFAQQLLPSNMERFEPYLEAAMKRTPVVGEVGIREVINGPIPFSADGDTVMGPIPGLDNAYIASGCVIGIASGGGIGKMMAQWIIEGESPVDLWPVDSRRFGPHHARKDFLYPRAIEIYGEHYTLRPPGTEYQSARGLRVSPFYHQLKERGAVFGSKFGWERPNWFATNGMDPVDAPSYERPNWFEPVGEEHREVRRNVGVLDLSTFSKYEIYGPDALAVLQYLTVRDLDKPVGSTMYTQFCNSRGGIEADLTITRIAEDRFYLVTGSGNGIRDMEWVRRKGKAKGDRFSVEEVTSKFGVLLVTGPNAPALLQSLCGEEAIQPALGGGTCTLLDVNGVEARALRLSFAGEPGWELHACAEYCQHLYKSLRGGGGDFGIRDFGYRALDSLRLEKGALYWGSDITPDYNPYEAGLGFCVDLDKGDFIGRDALLKISQTGPERKLRAFTLDKSVCAYGNEAFIHNGKIIGTTTSAGFGYTIDQTIVYAYVPIDAKQDDAYEVEVYGERVAAAWQNKRDLTIPV
ncbi:MAG: FAD-dependent oxidoreductase, partial [Gammaproteobacteria bacterium]|nr:FAD-dependent oxidoreductase [Gammaproteobacteria bacterium]